MKKKGFLLIVLTLVLAVSFSYAGASKEAADEVTTIKFYGSPAQYNVDLIADFEAAHPSITVEIVPIDFGNAAQILKTGIASGNPVDVSFYWGTAMQTFVSEGMAMDLTPYLMENNGEWYNTFVKAFIDGGLYDGKYVAIAYNPIVETFFYNVDLFEEHNVDIPQTVDELMAACEVFKDAGLYGIGCWNGMFHQMLPWAYQIMANNGDLADATAGLLPFAGPNETPGLRQNLEMIRSVYQAGYWYPGEGALTATQEQVQAAWYQGRIAMLFDASARAVEYQNGADFEVWAMRFPLVEEGGAYTVNVLTNALFIPINAPHPEEAVEFIRFYTSPAGQYHTNASGRPPSTLAMMDEVTNPLVKEILSFTTGDTIGYSQIQNLPNPEINTWFGDVVSAVCAGQSIDSALAELERFRQQLP